MLPQSSNYTKRRFHIVFSSHELHCNQFPEQPILGYGSGQMQRTHQRQNLAHSKFHLCKYSSLLCFANLDDVHSFDGLKKWSTNLSSPSRLSILVCRLDFPNRRCDDVWCGHTNRKPYFLVLWFVRTMNSRAFELVGAAEVAS